MINRKLLISALIISNLFCGTCLCAEPAGTEDETDSKVREINKRFVTAKASVRKIAIGVTTEQEILAWFGQPSAVLNANASPQESEFFWNSVRIDRSPDPQRDRFLASQQDRTLAPQNSEALLAFLFSFYMKPPAAKVLHLKVLVKMNTYTGRVVGFRAYEKMGG